MPPRTLPLLALALVLAGAAAAKPQEAKLEMTDDAILKVLYDGPKAPPGFYAEKRPETPKTFVSVVWVTQLDKPKQRHVPIHAATAEEARKRTQAYLDGSNIPAEAKKVLSEGETSQYFELKTKHTAGDHTYWRHQRVWKSDFYQPSGETVGVGRGAARVGVLKAKPEPATVRWLAEFLWWNENHEVAGAHVLASPAVTAAKDGVAVTLYTALLTRGDVGVRDVVSVQEWKLAVDPASGAVTRTVKEVKRIEGKQR